MPLMQAMHNTTYFPTGRPLPQTKQAFFDKWHEGRYGKAM